MTQVNHQNNFHTNITQDITAGAVMTMLDMVPSIDPPYWLAFDVTNIHSKYEMILVTGSAETYVTHAATLYNHTTDEQVRMVVPAAELDDLNTRINDAATTTEMVDYVAAQVAAIETEDIPSFSGTLGAELSGLKSITTIFTYGITNTGTTLVTTSAGKYFIKAQQLISATATSPYIYIKKNGVDQNWAWQSGSTMADMVVTSTLDLAVGDIISFNLTGPASAVWTGGHSHVTMFKLGAMKGAKGDTGDVTINGAAIPKTFLLTDSTSKTFTSTAFTDGFTWPYKTIRNGFGVKLDVNIPTRNDSAAWGGGFLELQVSINGGAYVSLGSSGYEMSMATTGDVIMTYHRTFAYTRAALGAPATGDFTASFKFRGKSYDATLTWNGANGIGGGQFYTTFLIQEALVE